MHAMTAGLSKIGTSRRPVVLLDEFVMFIGGVTVRSDVVTSGRDDPVAVSPS
jgi:hypothetical protein